MSIVSRLLLTGLVFQVIAVVFFLAALATQWAGRQ